MAGGGAAWEKAPGPVAGIIAIPIAAAIQVLITDVLRRHHDALAAEAGAAPAQVFRWRPAGLPRRLQGVRPGPAVVSPVVELSPPAGPEPAAGPQTPVPGDK